MQAAPAVTAEVTDPEPKSELEILKAKVAAIKAAAKLKEQEEKAAAKLMKLKEQEEKEGKKEAKKSEEQKGKEAKAVEAEAKKVDKEVKKKELLEARLQRDCWLTFSMCIRARWTGFDSLAMPRGFVTPCIVAV